MEGKESTEETRGETRHSMRRQGLSRSEQVTSPHRTVLTSGVRLQDTRAELAVKTARESRTTWVGAMRHSSHLHWRQGTRALADPQILRQEFCPHKSPPENKDLSVKTGGVHPEGLEGKSRKEQWAPENLNRCHLHGNQGRASLPAGTFREGAGPRRSRHSPADVHTTPFEGSHLQCVRAPGVPSEQSGDDRVR